MELFEKMRVFLCQRILGSSKRPRFAWFMDEYDTEEPCREALFRLRWPNGFVCPECGGTSYCELKSRRLYQCHKCHHQSSLTAGIIFHGTRLALKKGVLAIHLLTQRKKSVSALETRDGEADEEASAPCEGLPEVGDRPLRQAQSECRQPRRLGRSELFSGCDRCRVPS
jgi:hypothetical protein